MSAFSRSKLLQPLDLFRKSPIEREDGSSSHLSTPVQSPLLTKAFGKRALQADVLPATSSQPELVYDVAIIGAGATGLTLASDLVKYGANVIIIDNKSETTPQGRADTLQPKTIETFRQMRIADRFLLKGVKVHDLRYWSSSFEESVKRVKRDVLFPCDQIDTIDPYLLNTHQGFVENVLSKEIEDRGTQVLRNLTFIDYNVTPTHINIISESNATHEKVAFRSRYLVGADGAHSLVRKTMGAIQVGPGNGEVWAIMDGEIETEFPDIYNKTVVSFEDGKSLMILPRQRGMTRMYVQMSVSGEALSKDELHQRTAKERVKVMLEPYAVRWKFMDAFGFFQVSRKIASKFMDDDAKVFIAGDAAHVHSPLSIGMNIGIHDACNLSWKLNLALRGLADKKILLTYEDERRQVADTFVDYDCEEYDALHSGDADIYAQNSVRHARVISGYGADYAPNLLNVFQKGSLLGELRCGSLPPPAKVTRMIDANPVDLQIDIPLLGQFRIFFFTKTLEHSYEFLEAITTYAITGDSVMGKATRATNTSYTTQPPMEARSDNFIRPERYTPLSGLFTFALVLQMAMEEVEMADLPAPFRESRWTVYLDDIPYTDTRGMNCIEKYLGACAATEVVIAVFRPDGYVGFMLRSRGTKEKAAKACVALDEYFAGFLLI